MPPLFEGSALYMPTALPGISIGQASQLLQEQDRVIRTFPEVETVFGTIGRSDSATDNVVSRVSVERLSIGPNLRLFGRCSNPEALLLRK